MCSPCFFLTEKKKEKKEGNQTYSFVFSLFSLFLEQKNKFLKTVTIQAFLILLIGSLYKLLLHYGILYAKMSLIFPF